MFLLKIIISKNLEDKQILFLFLIVKNLLIKNRQKDD